ncbi:hypothetical protein A2778_05045 [Candidatus Daviesbacteria bacterium RIFCSPHIGHO2_01_FULL_40_24]|nr:MAG: hypothetical protein A2778_05045 [Candidatus Daviesbacteria bacterium RIFCSPHIGHO2_01_FULL_40_24]
MQVKSVKPFDPALRKISKEIPQTEFNSTELQQTVKKMLQIAYGEQKDKSKPLMVGLAAPQIGIFKRIILVDVKAEGKGQVGGINVFINPKIVWESKRQEEWYEGCYSTGLPATPRKLGLRGGRGGVCGIVSRPALIKIQALKLQSRFVSSNSIRDWEAKVVEEKYGGYTARIFQHEIDHLNGKLFTDCIKDPDKLHWVEEKEFPLYRNKEAWRNWLKKYNMKKKVLVITGGISSERKISLISAKEVKKALEEEGFEVKLFDLKKGYSALSRMLPLYDVFFPMLHGEEGEGGSLQEFLAKNGKTYVGGDPKGFKQGWFKIPFKKYCDKNKILSSRWKIVKNENDIMEFGFPVVLKASHGGSSKEVIILKTRRDLKRKNFRDLINSKAEIFIEKYLPGIEVTVPILDNNALPVIEIVPPEGKWFDYKNKYSGATKEIVGAPSLNENQKRKVQQIAENIHRKLNLGQYSRIDFILSEGIPYVLEVNTIPGFTSESLFPRAAKAIGLPFPKLVKKLVELA